MALCNALVRSMWKRGRFRPWTTATLVSPTVLVSFARDSLVAIGSVEAKSFAAWSSEEFCLVGAFSRSCVCCWRRLNLLSRSSAAAAAESDPPISATLKMGFHRWNSGSFEEGYPKPACTSARLVQRLVIHAMCHSGFSGDAQRSSWLRTSIRCWTEVMSTLLTDEKSRIIAFRVGRSSRMTSTFPLRGPGSFHGRSYSLRSVIATRNPTVKDADVRRWRRRNMDRSAWSV